MGGLCYKAVKVIIKELDEIDVVKDKPDGNIVNNESKEKCIKITNNIK